MSKARTDERSRPWLPRWLSFLSGLPEQKRKRRLLAMIQAFADESGGKGQGEIFVFSALISDAELWARFADHWQACLDEEPKIKYFKMDEAAGLNGQFRLFNKHQRDAKLKKLCRIICQCHPVEFCFAFDLKDFAEYWSPKVDRPLSEPYFLPFQMTVVGVAYQLLDMDLVSEPFEMFFDENAIFGPRAKAWYPIIRESQVEQVKRIMPVEPLFRSDLDALPLQGADLTAWMQRNHNERGLGEFDWLKEELRPMAFSPLSVIIGKEWIERITKSNQPSAITEELLRAYQETFGHKWPPKTKAERKRHQGR